MIYNISSVYTFLVPINYLFMLKINEISLILVDKKDLIYDFIKVHFIFDKFYLILIYLTCHNNMYF